MVIPVGGALCAMLLTSGAMADSPKSVWSSVVTPWLQFRARPLQRNGSATSPTAAIEELDRLLDDYRTGAHLSPADRQHNRELKKKILSGTFDIRELCRTALGSHWVERSEKQQDELVDLMTSLMEEKAITSKEQTVKKSRSKEVYRVRYTGERYLDPQKQRALVLSRVYIPAHDLTIGIDYKLEQMGGVWKIYDVVVDGSSLVDNYAYQFDTIISEHGYDELVRRMERKLAEFRAEEREAG